MIIAVDMFKAPVLFESRITTCALTRPSGMSETRLNAHMQSTALTCNFGFDYG